MPLSHRRGTGSRSRVARLRPGVALLLSALGLGLAIWVVVPAPTRVLLPIGVGAPELSGVLLLLSIIALGLALVDWRTRGASRLASVLAALALCLSLRPLVQFRSTARVARAAMLETFGLDTFDAFTAGRARNKAFEVDELFTGLTRYTVRETHAVPFEAADGQRLTMEIYQPRDSALAGGARPVIVQIYGGAWQRGSPTDYADFARYFAWRGYVVFAVAYRHAPVHRFPAQLDDVRLALRWVRAHARDFGADTSRMVLLGRSAGAHLAMLAAYMPDAPPVRGVVSFYGPVDLTEGYRHPPRPDPLDVRRVETAFIGGTPDQEPARYRAASPISYVRPGLPPTLLMYGARDHIVLPRFGRQMRDSLRHRGNTVVYVELPWAEHAFDAVPNGLGGQLSLYLVERFLAVVTAAASTER
jgi:acetyl esterase/lipase